MTQPVNRPRLPTGRPPKLPPEGAAQRIEALAADGFSVLGVARSLGTSADTFRRWLDEVPALREAFEAGREKERRALHNMLYRQAMEEGNSSAAMFLLKARHGYREGDQNEAGNRVQITFALPGAMSMADFRSIEHGPADNRDQRVPTQGITRS